MTKNTQCTYNSSSTSCLRRLAKTRPSYTTALQSVTLASSGEESYRWNLMKEI